MRIKYQRLIDEWDKSRQQHVEKHYSTYDSLEDAIKQWKYLAHHNSSLGERLSIREAIPEGGMV